MQHFFLFPGQGAQHDGMLTAWEGIGPVREAVATAESQLDLPLGRWMRQGPAAELSRTEVAQPALLVLGYGAARYAQAQGREAVAAAGHSLGEITALTVAGALSLEDAIHLTHLRGQAMQEAVPEGEGAMFAVLGLDPADEAAVVAAGAELGTVVVANRNAPGQIVLSGERVAVEHAAEAARARGARRTIPLDVSAPFHCPLMQPAADALADFLETIEIRPPQIPVWSNARIDPYEPSADAIRSGLVEQVTAPVNWERQVRRMQPHADTALELAPGRVLKGLIRRINRDWPVVSLRAPADLEAQT